MDGSCRLDVGHRLHTVARCLSRTTNLDGFLKCQIIRGDVIFSDTSVAIREDDAIANHFVCLRAVFTRLYVLSKRRDERIDALACRRDDLIEPVSFVDLVLLRRAVGGKGFADFGHILARLFVSEPEASVHRPSRLTDHVEENRILYVAGVLGEIPGYRLQFVVVNPGLPRFFQIAGVESQRFRWS